MDHPLQPQVLLVLLLTETRYREMISNPHRNGKLYRKQLTMLKRLFQQQQVLLHHGRQRQHLSKTHYLIKMPHKPRLPMLQTQLRLRLLLRPTLELPKITLQTRLPILPLLLRKQKPQRQMLRLLKQMRKFQRQTLRFPREMPQIQNTKLRKKHWKPIVIA